MPAVQADLETRLTCAHIARECACHPSAATRWIQKGAVLTTGERVKLKAVRTPGGSRVLREDLDAFLETLTADRLRRKQQPYPGNRRKLPASSNSTPSWSKPDFDPAAHKKSGQRGQTARPRSRGSYQWNYHVVTTIVNGFPDSIPSNPN